MKGEVMADKKVWETKDPTKKDKKLTPSQKASAKAAAKKAGRPYPNAVDNINASKKKKKGGK
jgi:hypothetical protein